MALANVCVGATRKCHKHDLQYNENSETNTIID